MRRTNTPQSLGQASSHLLLLPREALPGEEWDQGWQLSLDEVLEVVFPLPPRRTSQGMRVWTLDLASSSTRYVTP